MSSYTNGTISALDLIEPRILLHIDCARAIAPDRGKAYFSAMAVRRLTSLLMMLALLIAPAGRAAAAEAMMPTHSAMAMADHCDKSSDSSSDEGQAAAIDCMIACAAVTAPAVTVVPETAFGRSMIECLPLLEFVGITPASDPPPPRRS